MTPEEQQKAGEENSKKMVEESQGKLQLPTEKESQDFYDNKIKFANKFMAVALKNGMVGLAFNIEYTPKETRFLDSFVFTMNDAAALHQLLTQILTSFQQEQARLMQQLQGKVSPGFAEKIKAMQDAQKAQ